MDVRRPSYLRIVVTTRCTLQCPFCHLEGDPSQAGQAQGLPAEAIGDLAGAAYRQGVRKIKLLGGEPLARRDIADIVRAIRGQCPEADLSIITAGVVDVQRLRDCFDAGLDRVNLSIHGWSPEALARHTRVPDAHARRAEVLKELLARGHFLKCNYVYTGPQVDADLGAFLTWAAEHPVVVAVLDDLGNAEMGPHTIRAALKRIHGAWATEQREDDPHSLPTRHLFWSDGLRVEVKDHHLGQVAPWRACADCAVRGNCREGIFALRLKHTGEAAPCMDRPDLSVPLLREGKWDAQSAELGWQQVMGG